MNKKYKLIKNLAEIWFLIVGILPLFFYVIDPTLGMSRGSSLWSMFLWLVIYGFITYSIFKNLKFAWMVSLIWSIGFGLLVFVSYLSQGRLSLNFFFIVSIVSIIIGILGLRFRK